MPGGGVASLDGRVDPERGLRTAKKELSTLQWPYQLPAAERKRAEDC